MRAAIDADMAARAEAAPVAALVRSTSQITTRRREWYCSPAGSGLLDSRKPVGWI